MYSYTFNRLFIVCICIIAGWSIFTYRPSINKKYEHFLDSNNNNILLLQSFPVNYSQWTLQQNWNVGEYQTKEWNTILQNVLNNKITSLTGTNYQVLMIIDPLDKDTLLPKIPEYKTSGPKGYFVAIMHPSSVSKFDCSYNFENKKIGYFDNSDKYFIQAIIQSYRMNSSMIKMQLLDLKDIESAVRDVDIIITYIIPESDAYTYIISKNVYIMGFSSLDFNRVRLFYPYIKPIQVNLKNLFVKDGSSKILINKKQEITVLPEMTMLILNIYTPKNIKEGFITRYSSSSIAIDPDYRCYGDLSVESKYECDSTNDIYGVPKLVPTQWDKPCNSDSDCPFFQKNDKYPNTRGKCILPDKVCEMPIGVLQTSSHHYLSSGRFIPFCYGCTPGNDPECCNKTQDYAFINDTAARKTAGLKTSISLM